MSHIQSLSDGNKVTGKPGNRNCRTELLLFSKGELQKVSVKFWQCLKREKEQATQFGRVGKAPQALGTQTINAPRQSTCPIFLRT